MGDITLGCMRALGLRLQFPLDSRAFPLSLFYETTTAVPPPPKFANERSWRSIIRGKRPSDRCVHQSLFLIIANCKVYLFSETKRPPFRRRFVNQKTHLFAVASPSIHRNSAGEERGGGTDGDALTCSLKQCLQEGL